MNKEDRKIYKECKKILRKHGCLRLNKRIIRHEASQNMYEWAKWLLRRYKNNHDVIFMILVPLSQNTQYQDRVREARDEFEKFLYENNYLYIEQK